MQLELVDWVILAAVAVGSVYYYYFLSSPAAKPAKRTWGTPVSQLNPPKTGDVSSGATSGLVGRMQRTGAQFVTLYGSQTGTAEDFSSRLLKEGTQFGLSCLSLDLMDADPTTDDWLRAFPKHAICCFLLATYGDGEPTDNARDFYEWLMAEDRLVEHKDLLDENQPGLLDNLHYLMFGLGNRTYEHFNAMARRIDHRLKQLGAHPICDRGEGDDNENMEEDFVQWTSGHAWPATCNFLNIDMSKVEFDIVRSYSFAEHPASFPASKVYTGEHGTLGSWAHHQQRLSYDQKNPYYARITGWRELFAPNLTEPTDGTRRSCLHVEIDISQTHLRYQAGDHIALYPKNDTHEVLLLARALGIEDRLDAVFDMRALDVSSSKKFPFPCPTTYRAALEYYLDIATPPKMNLLSLLARFAKDEKQREHLKSMSGAEGKSTYHSYVVLDGRNLRQILEDHPSIEILITEPEDPNAPSDNGKSLGKDVILKKGKYLTLADIFELLPRLQPRYYSISSSPRRCPKTVHMTASVVEYKTRLGRLGRGVATGWLYDLCHGPYAHLNLDLKSAKSASTGVHADANNALWKKDHLLPVFFRQSTFKLPRNALTPVILIGPGTGLAPFRAFLHERSEIASSKLRDLAQKNGVSERAVQVQSTVQLDQPGKLDIQNQLIINPDLSVDPSKIIGETVLFFGSRNRKEDFLYQGELDLEPGLSLLACAFSRETSQKVYVQSRLLEHKKRIWDLLIKHGAYLYVCGDAKNMAKDVTRTLVEMAMDEGIAGTDADGKVRNRDEAEKFVKGWREKGRYFEDVWS